MKKVFWLLVLLVLSQGAFGAVDSGTGTPQDTDPGTTMLDWLLSLLPF